MEGQWSVPERAAVLQRTRYSAVGSLETVGRRLEVILEQTAADEIIATAQIYDHAARLRSFELAAQALESLVRQKRFTAARNQAAAER
jgi:alkanesulfonate monooxygenase SsuD/methylene tetrahydromethanopterin reductase-like flavin-dependent oxidoreductase (luciferase family)